MLKLLLLTGIKLKLLNCFKLRTAAGCVLWCAPGHLDRVRRSKGWHMLQISFYWLLLYSAFQAPVNEAPSLIDPGFDFENELDLEALERSIEVGYGPFFLLLGVWLLAYRKLQTDTDRSNPIDLTSTTSVQDEPVAKAIHCPPAKAIPKCPARAKGKAPPPKGGPPRKAAPKGAEEQTGSVPWSRSFLIWLDFVPSNL